MILYGSIVISVIILLFFSAITLGIFLIIVAILAMWIKIRQGQLLGHCVKVSRDQLPKVYKAAEMVAERLSMKVQDIFIKQDPVINAYALGFFGRKSVVLHSATVESMNEDELISIIGHEFSHIKCGHTTWIVITGSVETMRIPIISGIMGFIFRFWSRKTEYTCDRGGLLASRSLKFAISALAKVTIGKQLFEKLNIDCLFNQKMDVDQDGVSKLSESLSPHPYIVNRIHALRKFYESEIYKSLAAN